MGFWQPWGCKPCIGVWTLGGYAEKYDSIENWQKEKQKHNLGGRWEDSRKVFVNGCNSGEFGARIRGRKSDARNMSSLQKVFVEMPIFAAAHFSRKERKHHASKRRQ